MTYNVSSGTLSLYTTTTYYRSDQMFFQLAAPKEPQQYTTVSAAPKTEALYARNIAIKSVGLKLCTPNLLIL